MTTTHITAVKATPYAIIYGREGADYPDVHEDGPYPTIAAARAALDASLVAQYGEWMIVSDWTPSDGESITTSRGIVAEREGRRPHGPRNA